MKEHKTQSPCPSNIALWQMYVQLHLFINSVLNGSDWSSSVFCSFWPRMSSLFSEYVAGRVSELVWLCWRRERFPAGKETGCRDSLKTFPYFPQFSASLHTVQTRPLFYIHCHPKTYPIVLEQKKIRILQNSRECRSKRQNPKIASHNNCTIQVLLI